MKISNLIKNLAAILGMVAIAGMVYAASMYADKKLDLREWVFWQTLCAAVIILTIILNSKER